VIRGLAGIQLRERMLAAIGLSVVNDRSLTRAPVRGARSRDRVLKSHERSFPCQPTRAAGETALAAFAELRKADLTYRRRAQRDSIRKTMRYLGRRSGGS